MEVRCVEQEKPTKGVRRRQHGDQRREYPFDTTRIKICKAKASRFKLFKNNARDQKARDHKEHIHADKASGNQAGKGMKNKNGCDGESAQPVYVGAVRQVHRVLYFLMVAMRPKQQGIPALHHQINRLPHGQTQLGGHMAKRQIG
jgi:hypothetical protein